jgi:hypothetical protein
LALGTDRYPPFTLADAPDYPARLDLEHPQQLNRWLPLVPWLLAFPQYILVGPLVGSGYVVATSMQDGRAVTYSTPKLDWRVCADRAIALLFTTRCPPGLFDLALGIDRWRYRLLVAVEIWAEWLAKHLVSRAVCRSECGQHAQPNSCGNASARTDSDGFMG